MAEEMKVVKEWLANGKLDGVLQELYVSPKQVEKQRVRYQKALACFEKQYGQKPVEIYSAPGRTEIGGNHTDHQNGKVLAAAVNLDAIAVTAKREDGRICVKSEGYEELEISLGDLEVREEEAETTAALIRGIASGFQKRGYAIGGFEAYITSDVLTGSGLSSSAAYETLIGNVLSGLYNDGRVDAVTIAKVGQEAENIYFGKPCGLMDQMACSVGDMIYIDFADEKEPRVRKLSVDFAQFGHSLCIVDTKGSHADLTEEYAAIPEEMKRVAGCFGKDLLCQVDEKEFYENLLKLREMAGDRAVLRAMHWFAENRRVDAQAGALERGAFQEFKDLLKASGDSSWKYLQNVSSSKKTREQGIALALAVSESFLQGRGISRVHGGGFAGTMQAFVPAELVNDYKQYMEKIFGKDSCYVLQIRRGGRRVI